MFLYNGEQYASMTLQLRMKSVKTSIKKYNI